MSRQSNQWLDRSCSLCKSAYCEGECVEDVDADAGMLPEEEEPTR